MKKQRKLWGVLLALAICISFLPAPARAYSNPTLYVANTDVTTDGFDDGTSQYWAINNTNDGLQAAANANASNWNIKYTPATATETAKLTLNGGTLNAAGYTMGGVKALIAFTGAPLTIDVINDHAYYTETSTSGNSAGIYVGDDLTITGTGSKTFEIKGGNVTGSDNSFGIYFGESKTLTVNGAVHVYASSGATTGGGTCNGIGNMGNNATINVTSGTLTGVGGKGNSSAGIYTASGVITVGAAGTLNANTDGGGNALSSTTTPKLPESSGLNYGIYCASLINNGGVHAYGGTSTESDSYGLYAGGTVTFVCNDATDFLIAEGGTAAAGEHKSVGLYANTLAVSGTDNTTGLTAKGGDGANYHSYGISLNSGASTVGGSKVTATGGNVTNAGSKGIYLLSSAALTVSSGTVTATGGSATGSYGIHMGLDAGALSVSGGTVTATGGSATTAESCGIKTTADVTISGGTVNATGGASTSGDSCGLALDASTADLTVGAGTLNATAANAGQRSRGVYVDRGTFAINSGATVTAKGGTSGSDQSHGVNISTGDSTLTVNSGLVSATFQGNNGAISKAWTVPAGTKATVSAVYAGTSGTSEVAAAGSVATSNLYAKIEPAAAATNYAITFNANGGSGTMDAATSTGANYTLPACTFAAPGGKVFDKWARGSTSGTKYAAGTALTDISAATTFYAIWTDDPYIINYNIGTGVVCQSVTGPNVVTDTWSVPSASMGDNITAAPGYYFPDGYAATCTVTFGGAAYNNITVTRVNETTVTVSGTMPATAGTVTVTLPDATAQAVPVVVPAVTPAPVVTEIDSGDTTTGTNVTALVNQGKTLTVKADDGASATFDTTALRGIDNATTGDVTVTLKDVTATETETATAAAAAAVSDVTADATGAAPAAASAGATAAAAAQTRVYTLDVTAADKTVENYGGTVSVTLPYAPDVNPKRVSVYEKADDGTLTRRTDAVYDTAAGAVTLTDDGDSTTYIVSSKPFPFTDVKKTDYFYDAVDWAELEGIANGTAETTFSPGADSTRAQTVTFLWRAAGCPEPATTDNLFVDVSPDQYYYKAVLWAAENGIAFGDGNGRFNPDDTVTRAQLATFLHRLIRLLGDLPESVSETLNFADADSVPDWAYEAFCCLTQMGVVQGDGSLLMPEDECLRGQIMTMLYRYFGMNGD